MRDSEMQRKGVETGYQSEGFFVDEAGRERRKMGGNAR